METQKDYLTSQIPRPLRQQPEAPRNIYDLADKQQQATIFTKGDERGLTKTLEVPDSSIPEVQDKQPPRNRFVDKMQNQFDRERTQMEQLEGADSQDRQPKVEQHPRSQPQPGGDRGQSHHGSRKTGAVDYSEYFDHGPELGGEYYVLNIPQGVIPPEQGDLFNLNGTDLEVYTVSTPEDFRKGRGGTVARSMEANGIAYSVNCLPAGHEYLRSTKSVTGSRKTSSQVEITEADGTTKLMNDQEFIKAVAPTLMSYNTNDALGNYIDKFNKTYATRQARVVEAGNETRQNLRDNYIGRRLREGQSEIAAQSEWRKLSKGKSVEELGVLVNPAYTNWYPDGKPSAFVASPTARSAMKDLRHNVQRIGRVINYDDGIAGLTR